jgi:valyl-tRNA synthetase
LFDARAERARLSKQRDAIGVQLDRTVAKLGNAGFLEKAAPDVVAQEQQKRTRLEQQAAEIEGALAELEA